MPKRTCFEFVSHCERFIGSCRRLGKDWQSNIKVLMQLSFRLRIRLQAMLNVIKV